MKIVLIRHGEKMYNNGMSGNKKFDPPLKEGEKDRCSKLLDNYVEVYNIKPTKIISSPFLRCRQTANMISSKFNVEIEIDPRLSEFLGFQKIISPNDFHFETYKNNPYGIDNNNRESLNMFNDRVENFMNDILDRINEEVINEDAGVDATNESTEGSEVTEEEKEGTAIWIVTHSLFITTFLREFDIPSDRIKAFKGIIVDKDDITFV